MNKKIVLLICMLLLSVGLLSGCIGSSYTEDSKLIKVTKSFPPPNNITENMTFEIYPYFRIEKDGWYSGDVYIEYIDEPWKDKWWGSVWFKKDGSYHYVERKP